MHFFNPPRYMHLVEIIRTEWTKPEVSCSMFGFLDERLGKGVVVAKDRPNFIANRIGTYGALVTMRAMLDDGYSFEEVDKITGPGRRPTKDGDIPHFRFSWPRRLRSRRQEPAREPARRSRARDVRRA